jgi:hypothetical protein
MPAQNVYFKKLLHKSLSDESYSARRSVSKIVSDRVSFAYAFESLYQEYIKKVYAAKDGLIDTVDQKNLVNAVLSKTEIVI